MIGMGMFHVNEAATRHAEYLAKQAEQDRKKEIEARAALNTFTIFKAESKSSLGKPAGIMEMQEIKKNK